MGSLVLTDALFAIWNAFVEERTGIHYLHADRDLFQGKLESRAVDAGFGSLLDYYYFLRYDPGAAPELEVLIDALVVNETYFFREAPPLKVLCRTVLRSAVQAGKKPRVWCAGCATGEEPLTLAMMLADEGLLANVDIVASDIGQRVLSRAREGVYGAHSLRVIPPEVMGKWVHLVDGRAVVSSALRDRIEWRHINLLDERRVRALGTFDAIICRNVLIYFSDKTIQRVVGTLIQSLREHAPLLVGASESLLRFGTVLNCEERGGSFLYMKATHG